MKILYIGGEQSEAHGVATALRGIDQNVRVSWASRIEQAARWLDENRDLAAVVVEAHTNADSWPSVLKHARGPASHPAVVAIVPEGAGAPVEWLRPEADDYIPRNDSLSRDLPLAVTRAVARARERHQVDLERVTCADLEQKLAHATAALQDAEQRHQAAMVAAADQLAEHQAQHEIAMARATATWDMVDEQLRAAALEVGRARQDRASAAADVDRLSRNVRELTSQLAEAAATHRALEGRLADAQTAVDAANARTEHERLAAEQSAERQRQLEARIAQEVDRRASVEDLLAQTAGARDDAERRHALAAADVDRLTKTETDLGARLADLTASRNDLERRLAATEAAFDDASTRATRERLAASKRAAEREAELDGQIRQQRDRCATLEQVITDADAASRDADQRYAAALSTAASDLAERQAGFDRELSQTVRERDRLSQRLRDAEVALDTVRHDQKTAAADVERLTQREADLTSQLADVQGARDTFERQLAEATNAIAEADVALRDADQRHDAAMSKAADELAEHRAEFARVLSQTVTERDRSARRLSDAEVALDKVREDHRTAAADVQRLREREADLTSRLANLQGTRDTLDLRLAEAVNALADADAALRDAEQRHEVALSAAAGDLAKRQARFDRELSQTAADRDQLSQRLHDAEVALANVRHDHQTAVADVERLTQREADLTSQLADVHGARDTLDLRLAEATNALADADAARRDAHQRHDTALSAAAAELAGQRAEFDRALSQMVADRDQLSQRLRDAEVTLDKVRHDQKTAAANVERLTQLEADLTSRLAGVQAARDTVERQLADTASALKDSSAHQTELEEQIRHLTSRLADVQGARDTLDLRLAEATNALADADATLRDAHQRHDTALSAAAAELAGQRAEFDRALSQTVADRDRLAQRLSDAEIALEKVNHDHQTAVADVERLTQLEAHLTSRLADVQAARHTLEQQLGDSASALRHSSVRETELEEQIRHEGATRTTLEHAIADANAALDQIRRDQQTTAADVERLTQREADLTAQLADVQGARDTLEHQLADAVSAMSEMDERAACERTAAVDRQVDLEARLAHETATRNALQQTLNETRAAALDARRSFEEQADALRARALEQQAHFGVLLAQEQLEHESRLAEMQESNRKLALERDAVQQSLTTVQEQSQQRQETLATTAKALEVATLRNEVLRAEADQVPRLHEQLEEIRAENNRLFEQAGLAMFRCTPDGTLIHANRACTTLVGRRALDQLHGAQFAPAVFEAPDVLFWLIERSLSTRAKESIETTWHRNDGGRLYVRLSARRLTPRDVIEVVAEDLTRLRVLQARLDQAHRMEAVGRFASEVAVTCGNLLSDAHQNGKQWLTIAGCKVDSRQQGEQLLDEVRRAADLLHQVAAFGDEQARMPMLVDLNTLIRDLQPVLKRVAGDHVEVQLRDPSSQLTVDVQTERVERLLVNLASYGRERMPSGGRLRIDLGTIVVDRHFAAKHPNVRLGLHALITVTGIGTAVRADAGRRAHTEISQPGHTRAARIGVDVGTLYGLVSECGGHLWMKVQPAGEMVAKIRLPLLSPHDQVFPRVSVSRGARERSTTR